MNAAESPEVGNAVTAKPQAVPIRNLWHMLIYAWNLPDFSQHRFAGIEDAPTLDALFARILVHGVRQQIRRGLSRAYKTQSKTLRGIRGRIDFDASLKRLTFPNGRAHCRFDEFSVNVARNQVVRTTLSMLARDGEFGVGQSGAEDLRHSLRRLVRDLEGIDLVPNVLELIGRQNLGRNDAEYRIMLNVCELVWRCRMPMEAAGSKAMKGLDRRSMTLHAIYERFIANFYRCRLDKWKVAAQVPMTWNADLSSPLLPGMRLDLRFRHRHSGQLIILDTKFTPHSTVLSPTARKVFDSAHLYQIYAYLRSQEGVSEAHRKASGILLYPTVGHELDEKIVLQGHPIRIVTVDLAQAWRNIEDRLLGLLASHPGAPS